MLKYYSFVVFLIFVTMIGCQAEEEEEDDSGDDLAARIESSAQNENLSVTALSGPELSEATYLEASIFCSDSQTFTVAEGAVSMVLSAFGNDTILFRSLVSPTGEEFIGATDLDAYQQLPLRPSISHQYSGLMIPTTPQMQMVSGQWSYQVCSGQGEPVNLALSLRTGPIPDNAILSIQTFLTGTRFTPDDISITLREIKTIYEKWGFVIPEEQTLIYLKDEKFSAVSHDFSDSTTSEMVSNNVPEKINIFFVEDFAGSDSSLLGIASGLPGPQGVKDRYNAVLISLTAHTQGGPGIEGALNHKLLGETAAHEMGHWLGLHHTTEKAGAQFDPLSDTGQCGIENDANQNRQVDPNECFDLEADNLMFWVGTNSIEQTVLTPEQQYVIKHSPIAQ